MSEHDIDEYYAYFCDCSLLWCWWCGMAVRMVCDTASQALVEAAAAPRSATAAVSGGATGGRSSHSYSS